MRRGTQKKKRKKRPEADQKDLSRTSKNDRNEEKGGGGGGRLKRISAAIGRRGFPNNATKRAPGERTQRSRFEGELAEDRDIETRERTRENNLKKIVSKRKTKNLISKNIYKIKRDGIFELIFS